jgi:hypothetical protein
MNPDLSTLNLAGEDVEDEYSEDYEAFSTGSIYCEALLNEVFGRNDFVHLKTGKIGGESVLNIWTSVYSTLKEGVMKNCEELHTQRQIYEMFDTLVKGSLERIRKVAEKAKPILSDLEVIEKKMTSIGVDPGVD